MVGETMWKKAEKPRGYLILNDPLLLLHTCSVVAVSSSWYETFKTAQHIRTRC